MKFSTIFRHSLTSFFLLILPATFITAQVVVSGRVVDGRTGSPMPFVSIAYDNSTLGTITNGEGYFRCKPDTLVTRFFRLSFIGYESVILPVNTVSPVVVKMEPVAIGLPEVVIRGSKNNWAADLVVSAVKAARKNKYESPARAFLSVVTTLDQSSPLEVLEGFYQCSSSPARGISVDGMKNGRFGLLPMENLIFINKSPTELISNLRLFEYNRYRLPEIPFSLGAREMKKNYRFSSDSLVPTAQSGIAVIRFTPKNDLTGKFSGKIWIDTTSLTILKIAITCRKMKVHPFLPIDSAHKISHVDLTCEITFRLLPDGRQVHDHILTEYAMQYKTASHSYTVSNKSMLILYDYGNFFILPYYQAPPGLSDYGRILTVPFNPVFWERNYLVPRTTQEQDYTEYFRQQGVTVNYDEEKKSREYLPRTAICWQPGVRLTWDLVSKEKPDWIMVSGYGKKRADPEDFISRKYFLDFQVFLDFNIEPDTCYRQSRSMLLLDNSFFEPERDSLALREFRLEFDITELYRLRLERRLDSALVSGCDPDAVRKVYDKLVREFDGMRWLCRKEVKRGRATLAYDTWRKRIDLRLLREQTKEPSPPGYSP